jgi:hypothetical protein
MSHPTDTNNFDPLSVGVSGISPINTALSQLSYAITQLQTGGASAGLITIPVTAGESLLATDAAYFNPSDSQMYAIDANAAPALAGTVRGFVEETVSGAALGSLVIGGILGGFTGLTAWLPVYADSTGAGTITQTRPYPLLDSGQMAVVPLGMAISTTQVLVMPAFMDCRIRYQARFSPALDETTTVEHGNLADGFGRKFAAYVTQNKTATEYASSNQDSDVELQGTSGAGAVTDSGAQSGSNGYIGDDGGTDYRTSQSFTMSALGRLTQFTFTLGANTGTPAGNMGWEIRDNNAGVPGSTVLTSGTIPNASVVASSINTVNVSSGPILQSATTYHLVLYSTTANEATNNRWNWTLSVAGSYANGSRSFSTNAGSSWTNQAAVDCTFTVTTSAVTPNEKLAQGFQVTDAGTVSSVKLWLKKVGSPTGNLTVKIQTNNAGSPSGSTITNGTSATVAASSLSTSYGYITFTFSTPPSLSAATQYHIVLETADSQSNTNYVVWGADGSTPSYASGEMKRERSAAWSAESKDAVFQVVADGLQYIQPVNVDYYTSTLADMVAQAGDTSGTDIDTKSTFKCKAAAGFADIVVEIAA